MTTYTNYDLVKIGIKICQDHQSFEPIINRQMQKTIIENNITFDVNQFMKQKKGEINKKDLVEFAYNIYKKYGNDYHTLARITPEKQLKTIITDRCKIIIMQEIRS